MPSKCSILTSFIILSIIALPLVESALASYSCANSAMCVMLRRSFARGETSAVSVTSMCVSWNCSSMARCNSGIVALRKVGA
ncbi:hypothetical protein PF005_g22589 [Phytophthora fragariae]|uniref:Secreted protein n=1 Tax=Phytophthora fragariae TaxID=53985 RepID=A0A6A3RY94_9STRA|nr:hypothetical protein PF003_g36171 [Phytophthora fragariae]KAE8926713.1 hypothetical protein PF009_g23105 [Phytophthora fragariae]KAE8983022.1 hypothetical protein PF011_g21370 [Phytophthora fragariae]KAE9081017.1 hypothetical protein PF010_g22158 [Phytophthora fragariae]KAE9081155.1 hypothetical protein PF007_g22780 [Phytophthora fragariae]